MHLISPVYARFVLRELLQRGVSERALFADTTLNRKGLETGGDISMEDFATFLENALESSGDEQLGLLIGKHTTLATLGPVGAAMANAPTVREGLQAMESFSRLHTTYIHTGLISSLDVMSVQFRFEQNLGTVERFHAETAVMLIQHYLEMLTGQPLEDAQYRFHFEQPAYAGEYPKHFHSPVSFGCALTSVELPHHCLDLRSPYYNEELWVQAQVLLARRLKELVDNSKDTYTSHVTAIMQSHEPPLPDLHGVAQRLHLSHRTLSRRLQDESTSFREIKAITLSAWAREYLLMTDDSVESIAAALGYQDAANFRRAFRAREGCPPGEFRNTRRQRVNET